MIKAKMRSEEGLIAVVALMIMVITASVLISVSITTTNMMNRVKTSNNSFRANIISNSVMEYLQYGVLERHESGYNLIVSTCAYGNYAEGGTQNDPECDEITNVLANTIGDENIKLTMQIKGRGTSEDEFSGMCPGLIGSSCYIVPLPGMGDAGDRCSMYTPTSDINAMVDDNGQVHEPSYPEGIAQIDYSCNWNKLAFGSSSMDRVAIPLYYDTGTEIINPFHQDTAPSLQATEFSIRVRPPCLPCDGVNRICVAGEDETICNDSYRYELDESENDIVVQWQLNGECNNEKCGLIQHVVWNGDEIDESSSSVISEQKINNNNPYFWENMVLNSIFQSKGIDTSTYNDLLILDRLQKMQKPVLTLFLTEKLIDTEENNIPYLEYQIITDKPIGNPKIKVEAMVNVNGYGFKKTLYKEEKTPLIDFAIQN